MFKPQLTLSFVKTPKNNKKSAPAEEPTPDYTAIAEEALTRLGKKLLVGAIVVVVTTVVVNAAASIAVNAIDTNIN